MKQLLLIVSIAFIVYAMAIYFLYREYYSNFDCVSVYGNQPEYLRCMEGKECKEAFEEGKDNKINEVDQTACKEGCREHCAVLMGDFQDCCALCQKRC
jgi:hypothetical protein